MHLNGDEAMSFGSTFLAANSTSYYNMRKVYLTQHPRYDYKITIKPMEEADTKNDTEKADTPKEEGSEDSEIKYNKEVTLYKHDKDYLGQKKTI